MAMLVYKRVVGCSRTNKSYYVLLKGLTLHQELGSQDHVLRIIRTFHID